ncbi:RNA polymerase sigma factor [Flavihumibacter sp. R14]|nr:RNA polymerase sigma factor [Flavihumibacter soli]
MLRLENELLGCIIQDSRSKEIIYKTFYGYSMAVVARYVNDRYDCEELVNDNFVKIFKNISQFSFPKDPENLNKAFKGWIAKISSRTAIDFLRSKKTFLYIDDITDVNEPVSELSVLDKLSVNDILEMLNSLPEMHRLIFNMYEIEGYTHDEISDLMKIPTSSSRVYLTRAKNKLRELYSKTLVQAYAIKSS